MTTSASARGLDHLVIGVQDLDAAGELYARLGFRVGARNRHPWGTENRIVQFPGAFLELITIGEEGLIPPHAPRHFSFGAFVRDALERGEGISMLVLESTDAEADAVAFRAAGIGDFENFFFERQARRPDGSQVRVAFRLAFAHNPAAPDCGFFACQQLEPQNFWNPAFQQHENGTTGLAAIVMVADDPSAQLPFLAAYAGTRASETGEGGLSLPLPRGRIDVLTPLKAQALSGTIAAASHGAHFVGFAVAVPDLDAVGRRLATEEIEHVREASRIVVPAQEVHGCAIVFEGK